MVPEELQAVIFAAGKGSRMLDITKSIPKCLLPVGKKPLVWYSIRMLENAGFKEVILIVSETQKSEVQTALEKCDLNIKIDYFSIPFNEDLGTADSLRLLGDKVKSDLVCLSSDLITDLDLNEPLNLFRQHSASVVTVLMNPPNLDISVPGPKAKYKPERDLIGIDSQTNRLVFLASASDFEENLTLQKSLLKKHTKITLHSSLSDAHLYIIRKWVCEYLQHDKSFSTIKGELLPHIIKKQLSKPARVTENNTSIVNADIRNDIFQFAKESDLDLIIRESSTYNDHSGDLKDCYHGDIVRCFAYIADKQTYGIRVNTILSYWNINMKIIELWPKVTYGKELILKDVKADIQSNQVDETSIVWDGAKLNEKTSFKNAFISSNCEVQSKTRVFNSILMNNVIIKERCAIENCIVCDGAVIESDCNLKDCLIGSQFVVSENSTHSKEILMDSEDCMEV